MDVVNKTVALTSHEKFSDNGNTAYFYLIFLPLVLNHYANIVNTDLSTRRTLQQFALAD